MNNNSLPYLQIVGDANFNHQPPCCFIYLWITPQQNWSSL